MNKKQRNEMEKLAAAHAADFKTFSDIEGLIIRGHILVERCLNRTIELTVLKKEEFKPDRFTFSQKIVLAKMLDLLGSFTKEVESLNKLRNQIAHSLKYEEALVNRIIDEVKKKAPDRFNDSDDTRKQFLTAISFVCGALSLADVGARLKFFARGIAEDFPDAPIDDTE